MAGQARNHFHLVIETPGANLVAGMRWRLSACTIRLNHRRQLVGHVFSGRYQAVVVEGCGNGCLRAACDYVHLNPVRARLLKKGERLLAGGEELKRLGWAEAGLARRRKSDPLKLALAARFRRETTWTLKAGAARLRLGSPKGVNARLREAKRVRPGAGSSFSPPKPGGRRDAKVRPR